MLQRAFERRTNDANENEQYIVDASQYPRFKKKSVSESKVRVIFLSLQINNFNLEIMITIENCKELCKRIESLRRYL